MTTHTLETLEQFVAACQAHQTTHIALAWRSEWGPRGDGVRDGEYRQRRECRALSYASGTILACDLVDVDHDQIADELRKTGFTVELRNRNLTAFDANRVRPETPDA